MPGLWTAIFGDAGNPLGYTAGAAGYDDRSCRHGDLLDAKAGLAPQQADRDPGRRLEPGDLCGQPMRYERSGMAPGLPWEIPGF
jgi:hypothetical protein